MGSSAFTLKISILFTLCISSLQILQAQTPPIADRQVKIGLLLPDVKSSAALKGANIAIISANESGGLEGRQFALCVKYLEGPWGTGSKQAVDLIFTNNVWLLLGLHDGRNAHLVEQAATKARVVFVSALTGDPTLAKAFVPWFFNFMPNDDQQSVLLADRVCRTELKDRYIIIYDDAYDSRSLLKSLLSEIRKRNYPDPDQIDYTKTGNDTVTIAKMVAGKKYSEVILLCEPHTSAKIAESLVRKDVKTRFSGPLTILNENDLTGNEIQLFNDRLCVPSTAWDNEIYRSFRDKFYKVYGYSPGLIATLSFDSMNSAIKALKTAGSQDREKIEKALYETNARGVTGDIRFDSKGNRRGTLIMSEISNGLPVMNSK